MDVGLHNEKTAAFLIDQLVQQGIEHFCLSPGSRSTPLSLAVAHSQVRCDTHYDERGLGFYALGIAKGSKKPVAIITTSGTGTGNLLPAVMEASNDHVPLVLLTADRPQELRECSANQTTDQVKLFASFMRWQGDLSLSDPTLPCSFIAAAVGQALYLSRHLRPGPVHLNCMFREPFFSSGSISPERVTVRTSQSGDLVPSIQVIEQWVDKLSGKKKGLIIAGASPFNGEPLLALAEKLGWPIYADILSQLRTNKHPNVIPYFEALVQANWCQDVEAILHWGGRTVSKNVMEWVKNHRPSFYLHVWEHSTLLDPHMLVTDRLQASSINWLKDAVFPEPDPSWLSFWKEGNEKAEIVFERFFSEHLEITEPGIIPSIARACAHGGQLFLANSMPIRDADKFFPPLEMPAALFGNRGVSGIDGNIATAVGIGEGTKQPLIALIGDLAFLHDMNSLSLFHGARHPVCLIVINNGGGGIFSFLSVHEKKEAFEKFFAGAHTYTFSQAASLFGIPYAAPRSTHELDECLTRFVKQREPLFIEIHTDRELNLKVHQDITARLKAACLEPALCY